MSPLCFAPSLAVGAVRPDLKHSLCSPTSKAFLTKKATRCSTPTMGWSRNIVEPNFTDWEDQGVDLTFANISEEGDSDMIALRVDAPKNHQNQGYYRLIKGVTRNGDGDYSIGSWGERIPVPGWSSWKNQGAGVAVMENGNEKDIVVMMIDNPHGSNAAYYKIGHDLDHNGYVTKGWTDFIKIPADIGSENQGAGIDVGNISGEKNKDLVVFYIDNPREKNAGYYRIGFNLDDQGNAESWSDRFEVPNWFSWENQGGGVVLHDTNQNGKLDIIIFFIDHPAQKDNPAQKNQGYFCIGRNLDSSGKVTGGWAEMRKIPDWFSYENQGGGIAALKFPEASTPTLSTYFIDNPRGRNSGVLKFVG